MTDPSTAPPVYPLIFEPVYQPRVWGGRTLETRFGRTLPDSPIGESWELVDRPEAISIIANGPLRGMDLHTVWLEHPELFGPVPDAARPERFPLMIKLLDCRERLSVQVHPDAAAAAELSGEPKAELWVVMAAAPDAEIYAGLRQGTTREGFEAALARGGNQMVELLHRLEPRAGDAMFIPPGRVHAIGAGVLLCEIQQNSDTTWRVYDWDRPGLDGRPRPLHVEASMRCINFGDFEPSFIPPGDRPLLSEECFWVERYTMRDMIAEFGPLERFMVGVVLEGALRIGDLVVTEGRSFLLPAGSATSTVETESGECIVLFAGI